MLRIKNYVTASTLVAIFAGGLAAEEKVSLTWRGCGVSKTAFMEQCAKVYEEQTGIRMRLSGGGAQLGIEAAASGGADLGGTCRPCLKELGEDKLKIELTIVAWDALVAVVHEDNVVENISGHQLRDVLQQKIVNWSELGGADKRIAVIGRRGQYSGVGYCMRQLIMGDTDANYGPTTVRLNSSGPVEQLVERQPLAIAITGASSANRRKLKKLAIDGHKPTVENIASGRYPYFRPLYVAYSPNKNADVARFVAWLLGPEGQAIVEKQGTVSLEQGCKLVEKFEHFANVKQIANYRALVEQARRAPKEHSVVDREP